MLRAGSSHNDSAQPNWVVRPAQNCRNHKDNNQSELVHFVDLDQPYLAMPVYEGHALGLSEIQITAEDHHNSVGSNLTCGVLVLGHAMNRVCLAPIRCQKLPGLHAAVSHPVEQRVSRHSTANKNCAVHGHEHDQFLIGVIYGAVRIKNQGHGYCLQIETVQLIKTLLLFDDSDKLSRHPSGTMGPKNAAALRLPRVMTADPLKPDCSQAYRNIGRPIER